MANIANINQVSLEEALKLAILARDERASGKIAAAEELAARALDLAGFNDNSLFAEVIESNLNNAQVLLDILENALSAESAVFRNTLERLIQRWSSWFGDYYAYLGMIYKRLIDLRIKQLGSDHPEIADRLMILGDYLDNQNQKADAQNCLVRAVEIRKSNARDAGFIRIFDYAQALAKLGCFYLSLANYQNAELNLNLALDLLDKLNYKSNLLMHILEDLSIALIETEKHDEAELVLRRALSLNSTNLIHGSFSNLAIQLACIYLLRGRLGDACSLFDYSLALDRDRSWKMPTLDSPLQISLELTPNNNPYLEIFTELEKRYNASDCRRFARQSLVRRFSWAIPDEDALQAIIKLSPLIEIGAGAGYWTALLRMRGADVVAYDPSPAESGKNDYVYKSKSWGVVLEGSESAAAYHPERTLILCWPPEATEMAINALRAYRGSRLVYIGEAPPGCTANRSFHEELKEKWILEQALKLKRWDLIYDSVFVYKRR